jgi:hypothetical protein
VLIIGSQVRALVRPPRSLQVLNSARDPCVCPADSGLFEFVLVSTSVSPDEEREFRRSVSAWKKSIPDSDFRAGFDNGKKFRFLAGGEYVRNWTGAAGTVIGSCSEEINPGSVPALRTAGSIPLADHGAARRRCREAGDLPLLL